MDPKASIALIIAILIGFFLFLVQPPHEGMMMACADDGACALVKDCCGVPESCANVGHMPVKECSEYVCEPSPEEWLFKWSNTYCKCVDGLCVMKEDQDTTCSEICGSYKDNDCSNANKGVWDQFCPGKECECFEEGGKTLQQRFTDAAFECLDEIDPYACLQAKPIYAEYKAWCESNGGALQARYVGYFCNFPTSDGGKPCKTSSECESLCLVDMDADGENLTGNCSDSRDHVSCFAYLDDEGEKIGICID